MPICCGSVWWVIKQDSRIPNRGFKCQELKVHKVDFQPFKSVKDAHYKLIYNIKSKEILFKLLYYSLLEMRFEAVELKHNKLFTMTNALHNLPLKLLNAQTEAAFDTILAEMSASFEHDSYKGMLHLLNQVKEKVAE
jgi:hemerythrin